MAAIEPRRVAVPVGFAYALLYLYALGDMDWAGPPTWGMMVGDWNPAAWLGMRSPFHFEAVARLDAGYLVWLISPGNLAIALLLALLVATNIHGALALRRRPAACGAGGRRAGTLAGIPALLAGSACCAPNLLLVLGIPGLGAFAAFFGYLIPLSVLLLAGARLWQRRQGAPPVLRIG
ncbi:hypothetical protein [Arhodomonas sp. SL1]|uniref:hypothetical protein n=1 Tax=Arhodomonas sp. SL1 TaxID=3425691 RepID=UPI003F884EBE